LLNVPLMRDGRLRGILLIIDDRPRNWTPEELAFAHGVSDRTWAAIETTEALARLRLLNSDLEREILERTADRNRLWQLSRDIMLIARFEGEITAVNPAWEHTLGWTERELVGRSFLELVHPDEMDDAVAAAHALSQGGMFPSFETRFRHKDGSYRWISWSATQGDGFIVAAGRDISAPKALALAEAQLRQSQKMEAVGQLTGGVAHDFNNLLTIISTSVQLLRRPKASEEQRTRSIDAISKTVTRAARLTGQLLAFSRRQTLSPVVFDASHNVVGVVDMLGTLVGARIQLLTSLADDCLIDADPGQFDTAIVNLAVNARDAMSGAGQLAVTVRRSDRIPEIRRHPSVRGDFVAVSIADAGVGIAPEDLERIFEPFYTTKPIGHGTGLGLSQVFGFVKQSGGDVEVTSRLGAGTTFTLYFPRATGAVASFAQAQTTGDLPAGAGGTILVVEDNAEVASAVQATLTDLGFTALCASNAAQALTTLDRDASRITAVFSDVVMAGMDGVALAREIRVRWPKLPVVLTTGYSEVLAAGPPHGFELVAKPYDLDALAHALRRAIHATGASADPKRPSAPSAALQSMLDDAQAETRRQAELDSMLILDTAPEAAFDDLVRMAADICGTPIGLVSLIDRDRQWFKARVGLDATQTPREFAFCAHAIQRPDHVMVVEDATKDARFAQNPLVTGDPNIRFYAGAPLVSRSGHALGTLCVIAPTSRALDARQSDLLQFLADEAVKRLEQRRDRLRRTDPTA
jgi:PAS domain S-box-containing protein